MLRYASSSYSQNSSEVLVRQHQPKLHGQPMVLLGMINLIENLQCRGSLAYVYASEQIAR